MDYIEEKQLLLIITKSPENISPESQENLNAKEVTVTLSTPQNLMKIRDLNPSSFDIVLSGYKSEPIAYSVDLMKEVLCVLKPGGKFLLLNIQRYEKIQLEYQLQISGFINTTRSDKNEIISYKPNYEVGSSVKLKFNKRLVIDSRATEAWKCDNDDNELIDQDTLLDENDFKKPDVASLRVCGTTGLRKACKNCTCGLAEELTAEKEGRKYKEIDVGLKSPCGNCYLGDAFRCANCPYRGLPAFKPGEEVQIRASLLQQK